MIEVRTSWRANPHFNITPPSLGHLSVQEALHELVRRLYGSARVSEIGPIRITIKCSDTDRAESVTFEGNENLMELLQRVAEWHLFTMKWYDQPEALASLRFDETLFGKKA